LYKDAQQKDFVLPRFRDVSGVTAKTYMVQRKLYVEVTLALTLCQIRVLASLSEAFPNSSPSCPLPRHFWDDLCAL